MKRLCLLACMALIAIIGSSFSSFAQEPVKKGYEFYKEKYEADYDQDFEVMWNAVLKSIEDIGCQTITRNSRANDEGLYKGTIKSDFCVFSMGDSTFSVLKKYSLDKEMPFIRGGYWDNGRLQYKVIIQETEPGKVHLTMTTEMSGMESHVAKKVLFWKSNGILENEMLDRIKSNIGKQPKTE